jgi:hypothetical protein
MSLSEKPMSKGARDCYPGQRENEKQYETLKDKGISKSRAAGQGR